MENILESLYDPMKEQLSKNFPLVEFGQDTDLALGMWFTWFRWWDVTIGLYFLNFRTTPYLIMAAYFTAWWTIAFSIYFTYQTYQCLYWFINGGNGKFSICIIPQANLGNQ